jgi:hypothetical protein
MKHLLLTTVTIFIFLNYLEAKTIQVRILNKTEQLVTELDYWIGSSTEANSASLNFSSKGTMQSATEITIPVDFNSKKRNTLLIKGYLTGGGYVSQKYTISTGETNPVIILYNVAAKVKTEDFKNVMDKFSVLRITNGENQSSTENALDALIGAIFIYSDSTNIVYKLAPNVLKTRVKKVNQPTLNRKISGVFSSETAVNGKLTLPFVSASTAFESGDVAKFTWEIEDVGEFNWYSDDGIDLAKLFTNLPQETKKILIDLYEKYPNAKMKFIDKAFVIGRLQVVTSKSKKITTNVELNGANYVTASGNYMFIDDLKDEFILKDVITQIDGYDATILLTSLYLDYKTQNLATLTSEDNERVKSEYKYLKGLYPDFLQETTDVNIMKKAISDLTKDQNSKLLFIKKSLKSEQIDIKTIGGVIK